MKKTLLALAIALTFAATSALAVVNGDVNTAGASSSAIGDQVLVSGGTITAANSLALSGGYGSAGASNSASSYLAAGQGVASGAGNSVAGSLSVATPVSAGSVAGTFENAQAFVLHGVAVATTVGHSQTISAGPGAAAGSTAQELSLDVDAGWFAHASEFGATLAASNVH